MKYALLIYTNGLASELLSGEALQQLEDAFAGVLAQPGAGPSVRLQGVETATTVRVQNGQALLSDGPFVESKEYLGGVIVLELANLDEATAVAARLQEQRPGGAIEVRPVLA